MNIASGLGISLIALLIGAAMIWFALPDKQGKNPRFLRSGIVQMTYPVTAMAFMVAGVTQLLFLWLG
jgi:hypothetical protein